MKGLNIVVAGWVFLMSGLLPGSANANEGVMHYIQSGALLAYADAELRILYGLLNKKTYNPELAKSVLDELDRALGGAKKSAERALTLFVDDKRQLGKSMGALRDEIRKAEEQLRTFRNELSEETASDAEEWTGELGEEADEKKTTDWKSLRRGVGWLGVDLKAARRKHRRVAKQLDLPAMRAPPRPRGARGG